MKVVFVCSGNTCRSPMAEYLLRDKLADRNVTDVNVLSAGVSARNGQPPAMQTVNILEERGITGIQKHQSRPVSAVEFEPGDLVLTMTRGHERSLGHLPDNVHVSAIKDYLGGSGNISDPYGQGEQAYQTVYEELKPLLDELADKLASE